MKPISSDNFGILIAYLIPGFTVLWGISYVSPTVQSWIGSSPAQGPTLGGFLYMTVASVAAGMTVSTMRWMVIDTLHHITGVKKPAWDFSKLQTNIAAYEALNENHYFYYKFHANELIAVVCAYLVRRLAMGVWPDGFGWFDVFVLGLVIVFWLGSRDNLKKFYARTGQILETEAKPELGESSKTCDNFH